MVDALHHESSYVAGMWGEEALGVYVGWVARGNPFSNAMPVRSESGKVALVFSGEEFSPPGTVQRLRGLGHECDIHGPDYLIHLYEEDRSFPEALNGRFQGLITDRDRGVAVLFNDRYGMHRCYYHESRDAFYFAAEAKAILAVHPETRRIDPQGLGEFVACGCTLDGRSLFNDVHVLPGAAKWVFKNARLERKESYFSPQQWEAQECLDPELYYQELRSVFSQKLPRYFQGSERIGMSLTGGLDTRMIMAWQRSDAGSLPCYTFGGMRRDCQDVVVAREVAAVCKQPHETIQVNEEFISQFPYYAERTVYVTDGYADVSRSPDLYLSEKAREIAPIRMTGLYGSEVLRGVLAFKPEQMMPGLLTPELQCSVHQARETYAEARSTHPISFAVFKQAPWYHHGILALEQTQYSVRTPFLDNDLVQTVFRAPKSSIASNDISLRLIAEGNAALMRIRTDRGLAGERGRVAKAIARASLEFLFKAEYAYDMGMPQWLARLDHSVSRLRLEQLFLGRHKIFHFRTWYRDALAGYVQEMLLDPRSLSRSYIDRKSLETLVRGHVRGDRNYTTDIHKLLTLELLHRLFLDNPKAGGVRAKSRPSASINPVYCGTA